MQCWVPLYFPLVTCQTGPLFGAGKKCNALSQGKQIEILLDKNVDVGERYDRYWQEDDAGGEEDGVT